MSNFLKIFLSALTVCFISYSGANGQQVHPDAFGYYHEALKYSRTTFGGSARYMGLAGAATALGGDMGSVHVNPAGLGLYRRSEVSFSPGLNFANSRTNFLNTTTPDNRQNLNVGNFGVVFSDVKDDIEPGAWRGGSFGISFTRTNNFNNQFTAAGVNPRNSMTDYFAQISQGFHFDQDIFFPPEDLIDLAVLSNTLFPDVSGRFYTPVNRGFPSRQEEIITERGGQFQWDISYGGNFNDQFYIGASMGITRIRNITERTFRETVLYDFDDPRDLIDLEVYDYFESRGTGVNFTLGTIYRPSDIIRFGLTLETPTWYAVTDQYLYYARSRFEETQYNFEGETPLSSYRYNLNTPLRLTGGAAFFLGRSGFISADIAYVDYSAATVREPGATINQLRGDNLTIQSLYRPTINVNLGAEQRFDIYRLRVGFATLGNPYRPDASDIRHTVYNFTLGAGIRMPDYYVDFALINTRFNSSYAPYSLADGTQPVATIRNSNTNAMISFGLFF
ncbi:MAG: OmpP1/FadL family transporter [Cytophagaceae bacterium]